jgi:hypothetical protein
VRLDNIRAQRWIPDTRSSAAPLRSLETYAGFVPQNRPYSVVALAAERLLGPSLGEPAFVAFYRAIGQGAPWQTAFVATLGRSIDAFYDDFEAYRRAL